MTVAPTLSPAPLSPDWLRAQVAGLLIAAGEPIDPAGRDLAAAESLILYGLDSLAVMTLVATLKDHGVAVSFEELAQTPTLDAWSTLIAARRGLG